jgi:anti-sigma B factor antagonist
MKRPSWLTRARRSRDGEAPPEPVAAPGVAGIGISVRAGRARTRVVVSGELDMSNADQLAARLAEAEAGDPAELEIDLRHLSFMDSSGLAELFAANRRAREHGHHLVIVKNHGPIERVLNLARVEEVIDVVETPAAN